MQPATRVSSYDAVILGGGPAGSTAANLLAQAGRSVLVCERERFPRFHVGESLLPYSKKLLCRLGVWQQLLDLGFQRKYGGRFVFEPGFQGSRIDFTETLDPEYDMAFQVRRAQFDDVLLRAAEDSGAEVLEEVNVDKVLFDGERAVGVRLSSGATSNGNGSALEIESKVVIDASGRGTLLARQLGMVERDPDLRQAAMYTHVRGAEMGLGPEGGDLLIVGGEYGWFWMIPLDQETASVGVVFPGRVLRQLRAANGSSGPPSDDPDSGGDAQLERLFDDMVALSPTVSRRLAGSLRLLPVMATADFSYRCRQLAGDGWMLVGDAAGFVDPVFSSGVMLALRTGERAADLAARGLAAKGRLRRRDARAYERFARRGLNRFRRLILAFYDPGGLRTFLDSPPRLVKKGVTSAFAGKVFERDPRVWLSERAFHIQSARYRRAAARGEIDLPSTPAI